MKRGVAAALSGVALNEGITIAGIGVGISVPTPAPVARTRRIPDAVTAAHDGDAEVTYARQFCC